MKATELMIGDWVMDARSNTPLRVNPFLAQLEVPEWKPIPLTPEILEKNGFRFVGTDMTPSIKYGWGVEGIRDGTTVETIFYNPDIHGVKISTVIQTQSSREIGVNRILSCDIESVHELQHALRLCGIEKEIEL